MILVSGSAGFEALREGKKVILLGRTFYDECPNCYIYDGSEPLYEFFQNVIEKPLLDLGTVNNYLSSLETAILKNSVLLEDDSLIKGGGESFAGDRLCQLIEKYEKNIFEYGEKI